MPARTVLDRIKEKFDGTIDRVDIPEESRLFLHVRPSKVKEVCRYVFRDLDARYVISIGMDDRPWSGGFLVAHDFAFEKDHVLASIICPVPAEDPRIDCISDVVPAANWAEREFRDLVGIEPVGCPNPKRLILPDGWPEGEHPLRKSREDTWIPVRGDSRQVADEDDHFSFP